MNNVDILILGGGAAGLMAAAKAVGCGHSVIIIEKKPQCGKKLLITGKGRCNITNISPWEEFSTHIHPDCNFFKTAFYSFSNHAVVSFFEEAGLPTKVERGNRVFPVSDQSIDVRNTLVKYVLDHGGQIECNLEVQTISLGKNGSFSVTALSDTDLMLKGPIPLLTLQYFNAKRIIIATGGLSYRMTGSTGDGYSFAQKLGHTIVPTFPSLTALVPHNYDLRLSGISLKNIRMDLYINNSFSQSEFGEMLFSSDGVEGALGFRVSRKAVKALVEKQKVELVIDLKPAVSTAQLASRITREIAALRENGNKSESLALVALLLKSMLPHGLINPFISSCPDVTLFNLPTKIKNWKFHIENYYGYERAVITAGGVSLEEVSRKTMESKLVPGLYFAGEVLNLDGDTGGYNLQIAFSTGALAGTSAAKSLSDGTIIKSQS